MPTAAGGLLVSHARTLLELTNRIRTDLADYATGSRGHVNLYANPSSIVQFLGDDLKTFFGQNPGCTVDLKEAYSAAVLRAVLDGSADLGVFDGCVPVPEGLVVRHYREDQLLATLPADHELAGRPEVSFRDLLSYGHIRMPEGSAVTDMLVRIADRMDRPLRFAFTVGSEEAARSLVSRGMGVVVLPEGFVRPYEGGLSIRGVKLIDPWARRKLCICVRPGPQPAAISLLRTLLLGS
jgi:DNA-binding transcriptional LysR family regulator